jgi:TrmH family RNA methyltransferase
MTPPRPMITSSTNPRVKQAMRLREAGERRATGLTLVDGAREIGRGIAAGVEMVEVFVDAEGPADPARDACVAALAARGVELVPLARRPFEKIAFGSRNEGLVAVVRFAARDLDQFQPTAGRPVLVIEGVEKPGNLGAILRTADAAGIGGVIACGGGTDPANPAAIRASLGTIFSLPLAVASSEAAIDWCAQQRRQVFAAMPDGNTLWHEAALAGATAIVLGSEAHGLSAEWQAAAAAGRISLQTIRLPMQGVADSLNVSATAAILAYEALRQSEGRSSDGAGGPCGEGDGHGS